MNSKSNTRNLGIDLLRIVSMAMVVSLHVLGQGGILKSAPFLSANYCIAWFFEIASYCAVNCYALISGYVGINSKHKFSSLATLWLQVALYSVGITIIFHFVYSTSDVFDIFKSFFPVTTNKYWYFTAYFAMFVFVPIMNTTINNLSKRKSAVYLISAGIVLIPVSLLTNAFQLNDGYSVMWLSYLYLVGAYIGKYDPFHNVSVKKCGLVYLVCIVSVFCYKIASLFLGGNGGRLVNYLSPFILFAAIALLVLFSKIKISAKPAKIISFIAPLSFSVYLIHTHPLIYSYILLNRFQYIASANPFVLIAFLLLAVIVIFANCAAIDYIRLLIFKGLKIRQVITYIENRITGLLAKRFRE